MMDHPKTTQEELINDLKAMESTVTKNNVGNTLLWIEILQCPQGARKSVEGAGALT